LVYWGILLYFFSSIFEDLPEHKHTRIIYICMVFRPYAFFCELLSCLYFWKPLIYYLFFDNRGSCQMGGKCPFMTRQCGHYYFYTIFYGLLHGSAFFYTNFLHQIFFTPFSPKNRFLNFKIWCKKMFAVKNWCKKIKCLV